MSCFLYLTLAVNRAAALQLSKQDAVMLVTSMPVSASAAVPATGKWYAVVPAAEATADAVGDMPRRSPLMQRGLTKQQWAELQHRKANKPPRKVLSFQYPAGRSLMLLLLERTPNAVAT